MREKTKIDSVRTPALRVILDDNLASFALAMLACGVVLVAIVIAAPSGELAYAIPLAAALFVLLVLAPLVVMVLRVKVVRRLLASGLDIKARVVRTEYWPATQYNPPTFSVVLNYHYLDVNYETSLREAAPTSLRLMKEGNDVSLAIDPNDPSRYVLRDARVPKQGRSKVIRSQRMAEQVKAHIVSCKQVSKRMWGYYATELVFEFEGQVYCATRKVPRKTGAPAPPFKEGDEVIIVINPDNPQDFYLRDWFKLSILNN
jgi:hypothetical protein